MRVLIVDDEKPARDKLQRMLAQHSEISVIHQARDAYDALQQIAEHKPDAVFLDIQMPEINGIELAASLPAPVPLIVFVTAYDAYALRAFDANAIDYLLKPYDQQRLQRTMQRLGERWQSRSSQASPATVTTTATTVAATVYPLTQLLVTDRGVTRVVPVPAIQWIETADNYVTLHLDKEQVLLRQTMSSLIDRLGAAFCRCHRRAAVQLTWIDKFISLEKGDGELLLRSGARVPCSRQYRAEVLEKLQACPVRPG